MEKETKSVLVALALSIIAGGVVYMLSGNVTMSIAPTGIAAMWFLGKVALEVLWDMTKW